MVAASAKLLAFGLAGGAAGSFQGHRSSEEWLPRTNLPEGALRLSHAVAEEALPSNFDWRNANGQNYAVSDWNQHIPTYCGACWIHGTLSALSDRIKVRRGAKFPDIRLGRQAIANCVPPADGEGPPPGCDGGDATMIHEYMSRQKMPDETCLPYQARNMGCEPMNVCRNCGTGDKGCYAVESYIGYGVSSYGKVSGEKAMMKEIYARGPIVCSFATDNTFMYNFAENIVQHDGVYMTPQKFNASQVDHDMEVAGWGETASGQKYWTIRNSWGTYWGEAGWFKLRRGTNELLSESDCAWAEPTFDELSEDLAGKVLGDYVRGIASSNKAEEAPWTPPVVLTATEEDAEGSALALAAGAFCAGVVATLVVSLVAERAPPVHEQPPLLG